MTPSITALPVEPVVGERFEDWVRRWAESEGRILFAVRAAAMHKRLQRESEARKRKAAVAIERVRAGKADGVVQRSLASWRRPGEFLGGAVLVNSVFALGGMGVSPMETEPVRASPKRHVGVLDAAAAVRLPQRSAAP